MEREIKKYISSVKRRLNLPKENRQRLLSDLQTTISARMEQGESWPDIRQSLGKPAQVAADYMEQMQEFAYRKSPWRFAFLAGAVLMGLWTTWEGVLRLSAWVIGEAMYPNTMGVIGGADGPTAIFVTSGPNLHISFEEGLLLTALCILGYWLMCRRKQK